MNFELSDILKLIGPAASIIFAAWIFMGFLQQRYDAVIERYRSLIGECRSEKLSDARLSNVKGQLSCYRRRCRLMNWACNTGLVSAIFLILTLVAGELDLIMPSIHALKYISAGSALVGFCLVIGAAILVIIESTISRKQMDTELLDVPDLARNIGREPGGVSGPTNNRLRSVLR